jgi:3-dehydro-4-phosphotetronate decarboxylase
MADLREDIVQVARSLFTRGYSFGTAGNISARDEEHIYITPTNSSFESLQAERMSVLDREGRHLSGEKPSKEYHFHLAVFAARPQDTAVIHLHSTWATAVSCLRDLGEEDPIPVLTPYFAMRMPCLPVVRYIAPGEPELRPAVQEAAKRSPALLLRNHGPITSGRNLREASALAEELEESAKLFLLLGDRAQALSSADVHFLRTKKAL